MRDKAMEYVALLDKEIATLKAGHDEHLRLIAQATGEDGCEPDDWRAMTFPSRFEYTLRAVKELRRLSD